MVLDRLVEELDDEFLILPRQFSNGIESFLKRSLRTPFTRTRFLYPQQLVNPYTQDVGKRNNE